MREEGTSGGRRGSGSGSGHASSAVKEPTVKQTAVEYVQKGSRFRQRGAHSEPHENNQSSRPVPQAIDPHGRGSRFYLGSVGGTVVHYWV